MKLRIVWFLFYGAIGSASNILVNPGFETGNFTGWTTGGTSTSFGVAPSGTVIPGTDFPSVVAVRSGDFAAFANVRCGTAIPRCEPRLIFTLSQTVAISQHTTYSVGFFLANDSSSSIGLIVGDSDTQIFFNGIGVLANPTAEVQNIPASPNFTAFSGTFSSGQATDGILVFQVNASGLGRVGVSLDDFFLAPTEQVTPEPMTLSLLAIGTFWLTLFRCRTL